MTSQGRRPSDSGRVNTAISAGRPAAWKKRAKAASISPAGEPAIIPSPRLSEYQLFIIAIRLVLRFAGLGVQGMGPEALLIQHARNVIRPGQRLERLAAHEFHNQLVRGLLCLEALLDPRQKVSGALSGNLESR